MKKYVATLSPQKFVSLTQHLPKVTSLGATWEPTDENIAQLSHQGKMGAGVVAHAARRARLQFVKRLESGHGEKGWLRELLHALACSATTTPRKKNAWTTNPDSAIWLAIMSRAQIILSSSEWTDMVPQYLRDSYRNGWLWAFGLHRKADGPGATSTVPVLRQGFFALQTQNSAYLAMLRKLPSLVTNRTWELSLYNQLSSAAPEKPMSASKPTTPPVQPSKEQAAVKKGEAWGEWAAMPKPETEAGKPVEVTTKYASDWPILGTKTSRRRR